MTFFFFFFSKTVLVIRRRLPAIFPGKIENESGFLNILKLAKIKIISKVLFDRWLHIIKQGLMHSE